MKHSPQKSPNFNHLGPQVYQPMETQESDVQNETKYDIYVSNIKKLVKLKSMHMDAIEEKNMSSPSHQERFESVNDQITEEAKYTQQSLVGFLSTGTKKGLEATMHLDITSVN